MEQINAIDAQSMGFYGQGVRILYIDTGFDLSHEAFDSLQVVGQYDFINDDQITSNENEEEEQNNQDEHGSLCLSVLSGFKEGELIGPAFKSEFLLAKTEIVDQEIEQEEDNYVAALEWGEGSGADIACASLGYIDWYNYQDLDGNTSPTTIAVDIASSLGVLCVNSAGNSGDDSWYYIMAPADADSVLSVGSVTSEGVLSSFSSHGPTYDGRIKPEVCARGSSTYCIRPGTNSEYRYASGTSLSAPLAAGAAAIVLSANPSWNAMNVREAIMKTASMSELPNNDYGYGILNTVEALEYDFNLLIDKSNFSPEKYTLEVFPNPFNPSLNIRLSDLTGQAVNVDIFSMNGRFITSLIQNRIIKTSSTIDWTPANQSSGIYFLRINVNGRLKYQKVTFIK
jgi:subtilisin family serine protease